MRPAGAGLSTDGPGLLAPSIWHVPSTAIRPRRDDRRGKHGQSGHRHLGAPLPRRRPGRHPLGRGRGAPRSAADTVRTLRYMQDIESHTIIYVRQLLATRAIDDPDVGDLPRLLVLRGDLPRSRAGAPAGGGRPRDRSRGSARGSRGCTGLEERALGLVSRAWPDFVAVHMTWGAINELTTLTGYQRLAELDPHPVLVELLGAHRARRVAALRLLLSPGGAPARRPARRARGALPGRSLLGARRQRRAARRRGALPRRPPLRRPRRSRGRAPDRRDHPPPAGLRGRRARRGVGRPSTRRVSPCRRRPRARAAGASTAGCRRAAPRSRARGPAAVRAAPPSSGGRACPNAAATRSG